MRIGINGSAVMLMGASLEALGDHACEAAADGFASYWLNQSTTGPGLDALTCLAVIAPRAPRIEFGTAIVPTFPRHPAALASQALTTQLASGGRLALGIGLSHRETIEGRLRIPFARPIRHMQEYLAILRPLLEERRVSFRGELFSCDAELTVQSGPAPSILVAALGAQMLGLTGRLADGTILWLVGARTIATHIAPTIARAASRAGRPAPRIVASLPVCVTDDPGGVRETVSAILAGYGELPFYRAVLDREGVARPGDVAILGNEKSVREQLARFREAGTTDFAAVEFPAGREEMRRTRELLKAMAAEVRG
jgi:F420-dependent oxidoreductase-like protein